GRALFAPQAGDRREGRGGDVPAVADVRRHAPAVGGGERRPAARLRLRRHGPGATGRLGQARRRPGHARLPRRERLHQGGGRARPRDRRPSEGDRGRSLSHPGAARRRVRLSQRSRTEELAEPLGAGAARGRTGDAGAQLAAGQRLRAARAVRGRDRPALHRSRGVRAARFFDRHGGRSQHHSLDRRRAGDRLRSDSAQHPGDGSPVCHRPRPARHHLAARARRGPLHPDRAFRDRHPRSHPLGPGRNDRRGPHRGRDAGARHRAAALRGDGARQQGHPVRRRSGRRATADGRRQGRGGRGAVPRCRAHGRDRGRRRGARPAGGRRSPDRQRGGGHQGRPCEEAGGGRRGRDGTLAVLGRSGPAMTALSLRNPIAILMAAIGLVVFALVVTPRMSVDTFPELTPPVLVVGTMAPGLGPKDVEKTLTWRIEKYVSATPGVDHVQSVSRNNLSVVYVWLKWGTDLNAAQTLVQQQVAFAMAAVPKSLGVLPPFVLQYDPSNAPVVQVAVTGGGLSGPQLYDYAQNYIEPVLEGIPGVASASINGGRQRQINVVIDPIKAQARGITSTDVARAVHDSNALLPSGEFIANKFDANVYTNAVPPQVQAIGEAVVKKHGGAPVLIRDVARVEDGGAPETQAVSVEGHNAVYLNVLRVPGGNTLEIVDAVKQKVHDLTGLPAGLRVLPVFDQSTFVRTTYHGLKKEVIQALVLIAIVILLFLQSTRGTLIVSVAIPLSFAITLLVLYANGQTLNAFTLGGLTLAMGRLVDDAVVVLESIHRHQRMGLSNYQAALQGTNAVALPVLASTLTTMAVLLPVLLLAGLAQKLFVPLALTVAVAMTASYFVSICVTPVACRYFLGHGKHGRLGTAVEAFIDRIADRY